MGVVIPGQPVNAGVNHDLIGLGKPIGKTFDQQRFVILCQIVGDGNFDLAGDLGVLPPRVDFDLVPKRGPVCELHWGSFRKHQGKRLDILFPAIVP